MNFESRQVTVLVSEGTNPPPHKVAQPNLCWPRRASSETDAGLQLFYTLSHLNHWHGIFRQRQSPNIQRPTDNERCTKIKQSKNINIFPFSPVFSYSMPPCGLAVCSH